MAFLIQFLSLELVTSTIRLSICSGPHHPSSTALPSQWQSYGIVNDQWRQLAIPSYTHVIIIMIESGVSATAKNKDKHNICQDNSTTTTQHNQNEAEFLVYSYLYLLISYLLSNLLVFLNLVELLHVFDIEFCASLTSYCLFLCVWPLTTLILFAICSFVCFLSFWVYSTLRDKPSHWLVIFRHFFLILW